MATRSGFDPSSSPSSSSFRRLTPSGTWMALILLLVLCPLSLALPEELKAQGQIYWSQCTSPEDGIMIQHGWVHNCTQSTTFSLLGCPTKTTNYDSTTGRMEPHVRLYRRGIYDADPNTKDCQSPNIQMIDCQWSTPIIRCVDLNGRECFTPSGTKVPYETGLEERNQRYFCYGKDFDIENRTHHRILTVHAFLHQCELDRNVQHIPAKQYDGYCDKREPKYLIDDGKSFVLLREVHESPQNTVTQFFPELYQRGRDAQTVIPYNSRRVLVNRYYNYSCVYDDDFVEAPPNKRWRKRTGKLVFHSCVSEAGDLQIPLGTEIIKDGLVHKCSENGEWPSYVAYPEDRYKDNEA